jgi:hypothetical protein
MATAAVALLAAASAPARPMTTEPGVIYVVPAKLTNTKVVIQKDKLFRHGMPRYPRGAVIRYEVRNTTRKTLVFQIWTARTLPIKPGHKDSMLVNWNYRGTFKFRMLFHGKPVGSAGTVTIF